MAETIFAIVALAVVFAVLGSHRGKHSQAKESLAVSTIDDARPTLAAYFDRDPWGLACAHMAYWRTDGLMMGFDLWWSIAKPNYMKDAGRYFSARQVEKYLREFAIDRKGQSYQQVMADASARSGVKTGLTLGPGESVSISLSLERPPSADAVGERPTAH